MEHGDCTHLFCYGILKRGFHLDLERYGLKFLGKAKLEGAQLYHVGSGVGLRPTEDERVCAYGEVFEVPDKYWNWLDQIESNGFAYTRKVYTPVLIDGDKPIDAWVYVHTYPGMRYMRPVEGNEWFGEEGYGRP